MSCSMIVVGFRLSSTTTTLMWSISSLHSTDFFIQPHSSDELYYYFTISELSSSPHSPSYLHKTFLKLNTHREALDAGVDYDIFYEWQWALFTFSLRFSVSSICLCKLIDSPRYYVFKLFSMDSFFLFLFFFFIQAESRSFHFSLSLPLLPLMNLICWTVTSPSRSHDKNTYIWKAIFLSWERTS